MALFNSIQHRAAQYASFVRTERALRNLPLDLALDIDIDRRDAGRIARKAVYGA